MNPAYAEVNRLLGQSESDRQLVVLSNVIREHLPAIDQNEDFTNISKLWERRNNTWTTQLQKYLKERDPSVYSQQDIPAMNNSFNVMFTQFPFSIISIFHNLLFPLSPFSQFPFSIISIFHILLIHNFNCD